MQWAKNLFFDKIIAKRWLPTSFAQALENEIAQSEKKHSGEIRIVIEGGLPWGYLVHGISTRERALTVFGKLRMWDTQNRNGVLIYLNIADKEIDIVADRGLNDKVSAEKWREIINELTLSIINKNFKNGVNLALVAVNNLLVEHFALPHPTHPTHANHNELNDLVVYL